MFNLPPPSNAIVISPADCGPTMIFAIFFVPRAYASKSCRKSLGRGMFRFLGKRDPSLGSDGVLAIMFWNRSWTTQLMDLWKGYGSVFMICPTLV
jgi:hypothetical protein